MQLPTTRILITRHWIRLTVALLRAHCRAQRWVAEHWHTRRVRALNQYSRIFRRTGLLRALHRGLRDRNFFNEDRIAGTAGQRCRNYSATHNVGQYSVFHVFTPLTLNILFWWRRHPFGRTTGAILPPSLKRLRKLFAAAYVGGSQFAPSDNAP
jgi:hypothetical protein